MSRPRTANSYHLLCISGHDNEHSRYLEQAGRDGPAPGTEQGSPATQRPFAALESLLKGSK